MGSVDLTVRQLSGYHIEPDNWRFAFLGVEQEFTAGELEFVVGQAAAQEVE
jgi:hypothetical protein